MASAPDARAAMQSRQLTSFSSTAKTSVCLSYFSLGSSSAHLRYAIRRIRRQIPAAKIIACMWGRHENDLSKADRQALGADTYARSLTEAVTFCRELAGWQVPSPGSAESPP